MSVLNILSLLLVIFTAFFWAGFAAACLNYLRHLTEGKQQLTGSNQNRRLENVAKSLKDFFTLKKHSKFREPFLLASLLLFIVVQIRLIIVGGF